MWEVEGGYLCLEWGHLACSWFFTWEDTFYCLPAALPVPFPSAFPLLGGGPRFCICCELLFLYIPHLYHSTFVPMLCYFLPSCPCVVLGRHTAPGGGGPAVQGCHHVGGGGGMQLHTCPITQGLCATPYLAPLPTRSVYSTCPCLPGIVTTSPLPAACLYIPHTYAQPSPSALACPTLGLPLPLWGHCKIGVDGDLVLCPFM